MAKKTSKKKTVSKAKPRAKAKKAAPKKPSAAKLKPIKGKPATIIVVAPQKKLVGHVVHYYNKINVGIVRVTDHEVAMGDEISIEGAHTKIKQKVSSMQLEHKPVNIARKGQTIGLKVSGRVRKSDAVYKIVRQM